jgi:peptidoglycan LD-endopeptidase CwlK
MNLDTIIRAVQKEVGADVDGMAGPETWGKIYTRLVAKQSDDVATQEQFEALYQPADARSERAIATLLPPVRRYARALVHAAAEQGITIIVTSGTRTYEEQDGLYEQGRTKPGRIVTNARGGYSNHNHGIAFDVTIFANGQPIWESPNYKALGAIGRSLGLTWGGDWQSLNDEPHFELRPNWAAGMSERDMLAELRLRQSRREDAFA